MAHYLDWIYLASTLKNSLFSEGWGDIFDLNPISPQHLDDIPNLQVTSEGSWEKTPSGYIKNYEFMSPYKHENFPQECQRIPTIVLNPQEKFDDNSKFAILIAASGDEGFYSRLPISKLLLKKGIGSVICEGPFYGLRRPAGQIGSCLRTVGDLGHLGLATLAENRSIAAWLLRQGVNKICYAGISRGGQLAIISASISRFPVAVASVTGAFSAAPILNQGLMSKRICWKSLNHPQGKNIGMEKALEISNVYHYPPPILENRIQLIGANSDGYVEPEWVQKLHEYIPKSKLDWVNGGHVSTYIFQREKYANAICQLLR